MLPRAHLFLCCCLAILALSGCQKSDPLSDLLDGERGRVVRIIDGDALVLDTGQSIRLIGIEAPARPYKDREGGDHHEESRRMLEDIVLGRTVQLKYAGLTRDRYDRALAHLKTTDDLGPPYWVNQEMVIRGGARVRIYPDTAQANAPLLADERSARDAERGLWSLKTYTIPDAGNLPPDFARFQLVHAILDERLSSNAPRISCAWALKRSPLQLNITRNAAELCQTASNSPIIARGYIKDGVMEITHALNLQIMAE